MPQESKGKLALLFAGGLITGVVATVVWYKVIKGTELRVIEDDKEVMRVVQTPMLR